MCHGVDEDVLFLARAVAADGLTHSTTMAVLIIFELKKNCFEIALKVIFHKYN